MLNFLKKKIFSPSGDELFNEIYSITLKYTDDGKIVKDGLFNEIAKLVFPICKGVNEIKNESQYIAVLFLALCFMGDKHLREQLVNDDNKTRDNGFTPSKVDYSKFSYFMIHFLRTSYVFNPKFIDVFGIYTDFIIDIHKSNFRLFQKIGMIIEFELFGTFRENYNNIIALIGLTNCFNIMETTKHISQFGADNRGYVFSQEQLYNVITNEISMIKDASFLYSFPVYDTVVNKDEIIVLTKCYPFYNPNIQYPNDECIDLLIKLDINDVVMNKFEPKNCVVFGELKFNDFINGVPLLNAVPFSICSLYNRKLLE